MRPIRSIAANEYDCRKFFTKYYSLKCLLKMTQLDLQSSPFSEELINSNFIGTVKSYLGFSKINKKILINIMLFFGNLIIDYASLRDQALELDLFSVTLDVILVEKSNCIIEHGLWIISKLCECSRRLSDLEVHFLYRKLPVLESSMFISGGLKGRLCYILYKS